MSKEKIIVNSWNEWDPLKHVIVGKADGTCIPAPEPALDAKVPEDSDMKGQFGPRTKDAVDKANQLLNDFSNLLEKKGIKVDRPTPIDFNQPTSTPDWKTETMFGCMPPRDVILTVGNEMLEATMSYRCRWFEYLCYRPLLKHYYNSDPNMRHESAPKPRLTDADYRKDYLSDKIGIQKRLDWTEQKFFVTTEEEFLFEMMSKLKEGGVLSISLPTDPGLLWRLGRLFIKYFIVKKTYNVSGEEYEYINATEHINSIFTLISLTRYNFKNKIDESFLPFKIKLVDLNLFYNVHITK